MPNWVDIDLTVSGPESDLKKFQEFGKDDKNILSADKFIPYPEKFKQLDRLANNPSIFGETNIVKDGFNSGGYEWCTQNWGTKWGFCNVSIFKESKKQIKYSLQTAWSPPRPLLLAMSEQFPSLKFEMDCYEGGMGFHYCAICKDGEIINEVDEDYSGSRGG